MRLNPAPVTCPTHHTDLTPLVEAALGADPPPPLVYGERPYRVVVWCPGYGTAAAHEQACSGKYEP